MCSWPCKYFCCLAQTLLMLTLLNFQWRFFFLRFYLFVIYLFIFREGEGREKEKERNINMWLPLTWHQPGRNLFLVNLRYSMKDLQEASFTHQPRLGVLHQLGSQISYIPYIYPMWINFIFLGLLLLPHHQGMGKSLKSLLALTNSQFWNLHF